MSAYRAVRLLLSQRGRAATAVLLLCSMAPPSSAHVTENHTTHAYEVSHPPGTSLLNTLNNASPIRHQGRVFHGYTTWHVRWNYQWQGQADGSCAIASVDTRLTTAITLPQLRTADAAERSRFDRYLAALTLHEEGHKRLGQQAAADIDRAILKLRPAPTCQQLENAVHRVGHDILERTRQSEIEYDRTTRHGCTQGACLP